MCTEQQHIEKITYLEEIRDLLREAAAFHPPIDQTTVISATVPYIVAFKNRKHIFLYTANPLTLSLEDIGTISVAANTWVNMGFSPGMRVFATNQPSNVPIFVRCTDEGVQ